MIFALELRDLRKTAALTYRDLARKTHYSANWLSRSANGRQKPTREVVEAFVVGCGGNVGYYTGRYDSLFGGS